MKEITDKLARELKAKLDNLERFCDMKAKEGRTRKGDIDSDWLSASVMCHDIRTHLCRHVDDMIKHNGGTVNTNIKLPDELPTSYIGHLMNLPESQYAAVIEDKERWKLAKDKFSRPRHEVKQWLESLEPEHFREDMRNRLNSLVSAK